ncbi:MULTISPECIES: trigger factor [Anaerococcus]|uniref:Trigger factor n=1 Tax=Anaerococcus nagyae TaxID=1755241 RepID=A0A3E2TGG3_9FIRM|nr:MULTISPECIES: trigger factor [Anaerococcus]MBP2068868.1 trigger factor [Anaerococcus nagyae]MDU2352983.1 trigger factor [Anaerococcus sp.]MDU2566005.1 trigger factor [Anaerococcus sp.]MDU3212051.1 trigger factor [Anaerococcus sp.]RGB75287.1 trigger factor [Anaerococcus nagyae]
MTELKSHDNNLAKFEFDVAYDDFAKAVNTVYNRNKKRYRVDGFRAGHVPRRVLEKMYGPEIFYDEAIQIVFPEPYEKAIEELELEPIDQPSVDLDDIEKDKDITFKVEVETKPHPTLGDYSELIIEEIPSEVTDEDVENELKRQQEENARLIPVEDREAKEGDTVNIDFDGYLDGERFEGGKASDYDLVLGSHTFIEGFEDQVAGHKVGDKFDVNVTFPEDYQAKEFQGKDAKFEVEINSITEKELPELDDDFAMDISEFETLDELKADLKESLKEEKANYATNMMQNQAIEALVKISEVSAPESLVSQEIDVEMQNLDQRLQQMGIGLSQYVEMTQMDMDQIRDQYRAQAEEKVKANLVMDEVALKEAFDVTDEEIEEEINESAKMYGVDDIEKFKEIFRSNVSEDTMKENIKRRKAVELLVDNAKALPHEEYHKAVGDDHDNEDSKEESEEN